MTKRAGVGDGRWGSSSGFLDYDLDGDLDLFVVNYVDFALNRNVVCKRGKIRTYCEPQTFAPSADILYRNDGDHFSDVSLESGIGLKGRGLGVAFSDYDLDGDTDIYVANDATMNFLYQNRRGHFVETGPSGRRPLQPVWQTRGGYGGGFRRLRRRWLAGTCLSPISPARPIPFTTTTLRATSTM